MMEVALSSAALSKPDTIETRPQAPGAYARAVWARLTGGALLAALSAWVVATLAPLRAGLLIEHDETAFGLTLAGVSVAASPVLIWAAARLLARGPNLLNPLWYWCFVVALGVGANTLALLFLRDSIVSVFAVATLGFVAVHVAHRLAVNLAPVVSAAIFAAAALAGEYVVNAVLKGTWPFTALDIIAISIIALMIVMRAGGFARIRTMLKRPHPKAGVTYAAMHLIALAEAPKAQAETRIEEGVRS